FRRQLASWGGGYRGRARVPPSSDQQRSRPEICREAPRMSPAPPEGFPLLPSPQETLDAHGSARRRPPRPVAAASAARPSLQQGLALGAARRRIRLLHRDGNG